MPLIFFHIPLKAPENLWFSIFKGYRKRIVARNTLKKPQNIFALSFISLQYICVYKYNFPI